MHKVSRFFKPLPCPTPAPKKLYLLKCEATGLYKIGATSEDVKNRISKLYYNSHTDQRTIKIIKFGRSVVIVSIIYSTVLLS